MIRVGLGFDTHRLSSERELILGSIPIPHPFGCEGHSDADVLIHAVCDALLGAANLRDIGFHFPDTDPKYKNISSLILLQETCKLLAENKWKIENIDTTLVMEEPKIQPYIPRMQKALAHAANLPEECISIKAKTAEKLGSIGRKEGIGAYAIALISK
ncbi:MAG: 2-C-methyl-D-erythritol 2,4-cyclodiphosphate synthase [Lentimicrobiaceae bacterium]|nr:2-C-methyl-D-erythritol 2,4-cyclodiphosphate synthase [Lentimicrobiaceae bacterium]